MNKKYIRITSKDWKEHYDLSITYFKIADFSHQLQNEKNFKNYYFNLYIGHGLPEFTPLDII